MNGKNIIESFIDLLMFRQGGEHENHTDKPTVTLGSIVWGVLLRSSIIIIGWVYIVYNYSLQDKWWVGIFIVWLFALFPGYTQYRTFESRVKKLGDETLCGSCRHFRAQGQLCMIYDEHVSTQHIPCEGLSWEPISIDSDD